MSTTSMSRTSECLLGPGATVADLISAIAGAKGLSSKRRGEMISALRTLSKWLGLDPRETPAHPEYLRGRLRGLSAAAVGASPGRMRNVLSLVRAAQKYCGLAGTPGRCPEAMTPAWAALVGRVHDKVNRIPLGRFARYCGSKRLAPSEVNEATFDDYLAELKISELRKDPRRVHKLACQAWNRAATTIAGWPALTVGVPDYRPTYLVPWSRFPATLKSDIDAYLTSRAAPDVFAEEALRPIRPSTKAMYASQLHELASGLVHRGRDPMTLRSLADLVEIETAKEGLRFFIARSKAKKPTQASSVACMIKVAAIHWVKVDEAHGKKLKAICKSLAPGTGMVERNRAKLHQFDDPENVLALITLPQKILARGAGKKSPRDRAVEIAIALMIEILTMRPLRLGNLSRLDLVRHVRRSRGGKVVHITIPGEEVKNDAPIEAILPPSTVHLLDIYLRDHRPLLLDGPNDALFPGRKGRCKSISCMFVQITGCIRRETGLDVNPHLFRHFAAKTYLEANPGAYRVIQLMLYHKSLITTTNSYCGTEDAANLRHFDEHVANLRAKAAAPQQSASGRRRR